MKRANYFTRHHILTCKELCGAETTGLTALSNSISYCHSHFTVFFVYFVCFTPRHITSHHITFTTSHRILALSISCSVRYNLCVLSLSLSLCRLSFSEFFRVFSALPRTLRFSISLCSLPPPLTPSHLSVSFHHLRVQLQATTIHSRTPPHTVRDVPCNTSVPLCCAFHVLSLSCATVCACSAVCGDCALPILRRTVAISCFFFARKRVNKY